MFKRVNILTVCLMMVSVMAEASDWSLFKSDVFRSSSIIDTVDLVNSAQIWNQVYSSGLTYTSPIIAAGNVFNGNISGQ